MDNETREWIADFKRRTDVIRIHTAILDAAVESLFRASTNKKELREEFIRVCDAHMSGRKVHPDAAAILNGRRAALLELLEQAH